MSRIAKQPIEIPENTSVDVSGSAVSVKGPKGELSRDLHNKISISVTDEGVVVSVKDQSLDSRMLWGTFASHVRNMIHGVNEGYTKRLVIEGVGYRANVQGSELELNVGYSHPVRLPVPEGVTVSVEKNVIEIQGIDKEVVGQFAADVRAQKVPEPYKGKGIRYEDEIVRRKEGKKAI